MNKTAVLALALLLFTGVPASAKDAKDLPPAGDPAKVIETQKTEKTVTDTDVKTGKTDMKKVIQESSRVVVEGVPTNDPAPIRLLRVPGIPDKETIVMNDRIYTVYRNGKHETVVNDPSKAPPKPTDPWEKAFAFVVLGAGTLTVLGMLLLPNPRNPESTLSKGDNGNMFDQPWVLYTLLALAAIVVLGGIVALVKSNLRTRRGGAGAAGDDGPVAGDTLIAQPETASNSHPISLFAKGTIATIGATKDSRVRHIHRTQWGDYTNESITLDPTVNGLKAMDSLAEKGFKGTYDADGTFGWDCPGTEPKACRPKSSGCCDCRGGNEDFACKCRCHPFGGKSSGKLVIEEITEATEQEKDAEKISDERREELRRLAKREAEQEIKEEEGKKRRRRVRKDEDEAA